MRTLAFTTLALITLVIWGGLSPESAYACDFEEPPPPEEALDEAAAVFSGQVTGIAPVDDDPSEQFEAVTFHVDRAWKGVEQSPVTVETHQDEATRGYPFEDGESYLVYAYGGETFLTTALYHRTTLLERADEDLDVLGQGSEVTAQAEPDDTVSDAGPFVFLLVLILVSIMVAIVLVLRRARVGMDDEDDPYR